MTCALCTVKERRERTVDVNDLAFSVVPLWPLKEGHMMVLPSRHVEKLTDLTDKESKAILDLVHLSCKKIFKLTNQEPVIHMNTGSHCSQRHLHYHIVPSKSCGRLMYQSHEGMEKRPDIPDDVMTEMAKKLRNV